MAAPRKPIPGLACPKCGGKWIIKKGGARGKQRFKCKVCKDWHGTHPIGIEKHDHRGVDPSRSDALYREIRGATKRRRYVITAAQNATPVHQAFFASLLTYCRERGAQLLVIPFRYKNVTSFWSKAAEDDDWWAPELIPYLIDRRVDLNPNLVLLADIKTQPTAIRPLQGFETISGGKSAILGHTKLELATVPTPQHKLPKILTTTGGVTVKNYLPTKAGKRGDHHHVFGACVAEVDGDRFHLRQINASSDGSFIDLGLKVDGKKLQRGLRADGLDMGDSHVEFIDPAVVKATFGPGGIVQTLRPRHLVWNDVHDFYSRTHHHEHQPFANYAKHHAQRINVEKWLDHTFAFIDKVTPKDSTNVFVYSNHPDMFRRWVERADWKSDPENALFLSRTTTACLEAARMEDGGATTIDPFAWWGRKKLKCIKRSVFLGPRQHYTIRGVEVGYHGHVGPNGARGSIGGFGKIGVRSIIGHSHTPGIRDGVYQVGTSSRLQLEYVRGPSSWLHTHCLIYQNGKRSLVTIVDGAWRA